MRVRQWRITRSGATGRAGRALDLLALSTLAHRPRLRRRRQSPFYAQRTMKLHHLFDLCRKAVTAWIDDFAPSMGAAISYYTMFSLAPLLVIVMCGVDLYLKARLPHFDALACGCGLNGVSADTAGPASLLQTFTSCD